MPTLLSDVRCWVNSGKHLLALSISEFDPIRTCDGFPKWEHHPNFEVFRPMDRR
jgi:hypothetical protein